jgi:hypothetical protein
MRLLAFGIGLSLLCSPAAAQQVDPAVTAAAQSRKAYYDCVYESVAAQLQQMPISARRNADFSSLGEQGFLACATEERVLGMTLSINNVSPQVVQAALLVARAQIKRTLRDIAANAEKNGTPQQSQARSPPPPGDTAGGYLIQVASQRSEVDAKAFYRALQDKFPSLLGNRLPLIKRADLGDKGVFYRALIGPFGTREEAVQFCGSLITAGGRCVVQRN